MPYTVNELPNKQVFKGDWKMSVQAEPWSNSIKIWIGHVINGKMHSVNMGEDGYLKETELNEGVKPKDPFLSLSIDLYYQFAELFNMIEKPEQQNATEAELKATKYHLEDMRGLVKIFTQPKNIMTESKNEE